MNDKSVKKERKEKRDFHYMKSFTITMNRALIKLFSYTKIMSFLIGDDGTKIIHLRIKS